MQRTRQLRMQLRIQVTHCWAMVALPNDLACQSQAADVLAVLRQPNIRACAFWLPPSPMWLWTASWQYVRGLQAALLAAVVVLREACLVWLSAMQGLLAAGFTDFARVGSVKRIAKQVHVRAL